MLKLSTTLILVYLNWTELNSRDWAMKERVECVLLCRSISVRFPGPTTTGIVTWHWCHRLLPHHTHTHTHTHTRRGMFKLSMTCRQQKLNSAWINPNGERAWRKAELTEKRGSCTVRRWNCGKAKYQTSLHIGLERDSMCAISNNTDTVLPKFSILPVE